MDTDRAKYEVTLAELARNFRHIEALVFAPANSSGKNSDAAHLLRIGVTDRHTPDREAVVAVAPQDTTRFAGAILELREALARAGVAHDGELALAVLAAVAQDYLSDVLHETKSGDKISLQISQEAVSGK
jgi:hypothetical protein